MIRSFRDADAKLDPLGLTAYRLAKVLHISAPRVNDLVRGERGITADTALRLSRYFGNSAQFWIGLKSGHDLWIASKGRAWSKVKPRKKRLDRGSAQPTSIHRVADQAHSRQA